MAPRRTPPSPRRVSGERSGSLKRRGRARRPSSQRLVAISRCCCGSLRTILPRRVVWPRRPPAEFVFADGPLAHSSVVLFGQASGEATHGFDRQIVERGAIDTFDEAHDPHRGEASVGRFGVAFARAITARGHRRRGHIDEARENMAIRTSELPAAEAQRVGERVSGAVRQLQHRVVGPRRSPGSGALDEPCLRVLRHGTKEGDEVLEITGSYDLRAALREHHQPLQGRCATTTEHLEQRANARAVDLQEQRHGLRADGADG